MCVARRLLKVLVPTFLSLFAATPAHSQASAPPATAAASTLIPGAWAPGEGAEACRKAYASGQSRLPLSAGVGLLGERLV